MTAARQAGPIMTAARQAGPIMTAARQAGPTENAWTDRLNVPESA